MTMKANILVVDDTPENLRLLVGLLKSQGYKVRPAPSGKHALSVSRAEAIDLILLDILMPDMDGYEVCKHLKAKAVTRDIPILFLSALTDSFNKVKAFQMGAVDYITKPFEAEEVLARVNTHLTIRRLQRELEARNRELARLVGTDGLTHIANRRYFDSCIGQEWQRLARERRELSLLFTDVDYFKLYNDHYGHQAGDECLKQVARALEQTARRPGDLAARYGGEEFVVLLPDTNQKGAYHVAKAFQEALRQLQIPHEKSAVSPCVTCSIGIACAMPGQAVSVKTVIAAADKALYQAKDQGRNRIVMLP